MRLTRRTPDDFRFTTAVCSYGYFALAPNRWHGPTATLSTTVHADGTPLFVQLRASRRGGGEVLLIDVPHRSTLTPAERRGLRAALGRILRLDEDFSMCHGAWSRDEQLRQAATLRFGRLLRSESLFEDMVKTICTCNITWKQTVSVVGKLVRQFGQPAENDARYCAFPAPVRLANVSVARLKRTCGLGYRAEWIQSLARQVAEGQLDLDALEDPNLTTDDVYRRLRAITGIGDYAASTLCVLLARYDRVAVDTELVKHFRARFPRRKPTPANIKRHYGRYAPYAYLVYWWELCSSRLDADGSMQRWTDAIVTGA